MQAILVVSWLFTSIILFSPRLTSSVHGYLLGDAAINCGCVSNSTALDGRHWVGETPLLRPNGKSTSSISAHKVLSADPTPYLTARISFSYFSYLFQVNPGQKFVRLHFYPETYQGFENSRDLFTVEANSFTLLHNFSASLATNDLGVKYVVKEYCLNVNETGILQITFFALQRNRKPSSTHAFVNGIEIISMPTSLYYTPEYSLGPRIVGQSNHFHYIDNSTALEMVQRLNVGGGSISPVEEDMGMFRKWTEDVDSLLESGFKQINHLVWGIEYTVSPPFVAPPKIYRTSRKLRNNLHLEEHFTWKIPVDLGFSYLVRLHFSFFGIEIPEGGTKDLNILIQNLVVETQLDLIQFNGGNIIPMHRDYLVILKGDKDRCKSDLRISLQPFDELVLGLLKGLEIFKLSNADNSLASPNPPGPLHTYPSWTSKIHMNLVAFGLSHVIMAALTILLALVNSGVYLLRRIYGHTFWQEKSVESVTDEPSCHRFSLTQILLATEHFNEAFVIGKGGFGKVYKGIIYGRPEILAMKRLKPDSKQGAREFWREIETLSKLRHVNLVSLLGYCLERDEMILVYEYMPKGTIADNLYKYGRDGNEKILLTWEQRLRICIGAAHGLDYLHTGTQHGIIHRDVKDTNILLDENLVAKISDFGLSKLGKISETHGEVSTKVKGTIGYLDPDYIKTHKLSTKSDVYAFGIVLLVVISGRPAVERRIFEETKSVLDCYRECVTKGDMNEIIDPCLQEEISTESLTRFMEIVGICLHHRPKKRPSMAQLVGHLENALEVQIGAMSSTLGANTVVGQSSPVGSNRPFEFFEFQVAAPIPEESIISQLRGKGNNTATGKEIQKADLQTSVDGNDRLITLKPLWDRPWVSLRRIFKPSKKMDLTLPTAPVYSERTHPVRMFSLKDIKLATKNFSPKCRIGMGLCRIGRGSFTDVYKGFVKGGTGTVAIKRFRPSARDYIYVAQVFQAEVELLSTIRYVHIVPIVGLCNENKELIVVYKYMCHGTLKDHLYINNSIKNNHQTCLTWEQRLNICIGAARGLNYLHEIGVIYRDLHVKKITLDDNFVAKISDFGLSRMLSLGESESHVSTRVMGTNGYLDPSYLVSGRLTKASDVYSFGIVLLVVLSGRPEIDCSRQKGHQHVKDWYKTCSQEGHFDALIDPKLVQGIPSASLRKFLKLIKSCLHEDPKHRPVMAQVVVNLEESLDLLLGIDNGKKERDIPSNFDEKSRYKDLSKTAEQVKLRAEIARLRDLQPKGLDIDTGAELYCLISE